MKKLNLYSTAIFLGCTLITPFSRAVEPISLFVSENGNVGIGTDSPASALAVNGKVTSKEVEVTINGWPDYVFAKNYQLKSLPEVAAFIERNHHLPNVPSSDEVHNNGVNLGEMDAILLRKIEELTLYVMQLKKENDALNARVDSIEQ